MVYNSHTGKNNIKLLRTYESITQKVLLPVETILGKVQQLPTGAPFVARKV
jgi:hypothetical protein